MAGTQPSNAAISGAAWVQPQPQAILGLSSTAVCGSAFTSSIPQAFQVASGGLFKLVVDPIGFAGAFPEVQKMEGAGAGAMLNLFASGTQGNVQVTLGTVANVSMGLGYDIHLGDKIKIDSSDKIAPRTFTLITGAVLAAGALAFQLAYDLMTRDDDRATLVVTFQSLVQAIVATLIGVEVAYYELDKKSGCMYKDTFNSMATTSPADATVEVVTSSIMTSLISGMLFGVALLPPVIDSQRESYLDQVMTERKDATTGKQIGTDGSGAYMSVPAAGDGTGS